MIDSSNLKVGQLATTTFLPSSHVFPIFISTASIHRVLAANGLVKCDLFSLPNPLAVITTDDSETPVKPPSSLHGNLMFSLATEGQDSSRGIPTARYSPVLQRYARIPFIDFHR